MTTMMKTAEEFFNSGNFETSFNCFNTIANDHSYSAEERSEALNMMGVILSGFAPHLSVMEKDHIFFYKEALRLNTHCVGALLNIVNEFGETHSLHLDKATFINAYYLLKSDFYEELTTNDKMLLEFKYKLSNLS